MPPKENKKETAPEQLKRITRDYELLVQAIKANVQAIQDNYKKRARALNDSLKYIDRIYARRRKRIFETIQQLDWTNYFKCDGYPNNFTQNEVRDYVAQWSYTVKENENFYDWQLDVDERSVLTQDLEIPKKTRPKLEAERVDVGDNYTGRIEEVVRLLADLAVTEHQGLLKGRIVVNVDEFRRMMRDQLKIYIDNFTKDILYNAEGNMECLNSRTLQYIFKSPSVIKKIWLLREIPQPKPRSTHVRIKLASTAGKIWVPNVPLLEKCFVRELWTTYDHLSLLAPRYILQPESSDRFDYQEYIENEWQEIKDIENGVLSLLQTRMNDIDLILQYYIELEAPKEKKPKDEPPIKKPKGPKIVAREKLNFGNMEDLDVFAIFEKNLIREHDEKLQDLGDFEFRLLRDEINLRNHRILGGIQQLMVYKRPYIRRWSVECSMRVMNMTVPRDLEETKLEFLERMILDTSAAPEDDASAKDVFVPDEQGGANYCIEMKLPSHIYWYADPIPCRWEPWEESAEFERLEQNQKDKFWKKHEGKGALFSAPEVEVHPRGPAKDFCLLDIPSFVDMVSVVKFFLEPNLPYSFDSLITKGLVKPENYPPKLDSAFYCRPTSRPIYLNYKPPEFQPAVIEYYEAFPDEPRPIDAGCTEDMFTGIYLGAINASVKESRTKYDQFAKFSQKIAPEEKPNPKYQQKSTQVTELEGYEVSLAGDPDEVPKHPIGTWTERDITNRIYDRKRGVITFWTKRLGNFGLAQFCYSLLPFKNWILECSRTEKNTVYLRLETFQVPIIIKVTPEGYYLEMFKCNSYLKEQQKYLYNFYNLKKMLQECGLDIFPREDTALYVGGVSVKDYAIELHSYFTMAICCFSHIFKMSEYNRLMSSIIAIVNVKDLYPLFEPALGAEEFTPIVIKNLYCGPLRKADPSEPWDAYLVGDAFLNDTNFLQENNYRDLFSYVLSTASFETLRILKKGDLNLQSNIVELLMAVKPLSYA